MCSCTLVAEYAVSTLYLLHDITYMQYSTPDLNFTPTSLHCLVDCNVEYLSNLGTYSFVLTPTFSQTTYENFRYRYDKNENPYTKGILGNLKEIFCTRIPPSMVNFRAWVLHDDDTAMGSITSESERGFIGSKEKFDIEMGNKFSKDGNMVVPSILQKLDYSGIDDNMRRKNLDSSGFDGDLKRKASDQPFLFPVGQEPKNSNGSSDAGVNSVRDKRT